MWDTSRHPLARPIYTELRRKRDYDFRCFHFTDKIKPALCPCLGSNTQCLSDRSPEKSPPFNSIFAQTCVRIIENARHESVRPIIFILNFALLTIADRSSAR